MDIMRKKKTQAPNELILRGATRLVNVFELLMAALLIGLIGEGYFQNLAFINTLLSGAVVLGKIFFGLYFLYVVIIMTIFTYILFIQIKDRRSHAFN